MSEAEIDFVDRALASRRAGDLERLRVIAAEALARAPSQLVSLVQVANVVRDAGLFDEAHRILKHINSVNPQSGFGHYELSVLHLLKGEHVRALLAVEKLRQYMPQDVRAHILAARLFFAVGGYGEGARALEQARILEPNNEDLPWLPEFSDFLRLHPRGMASYLSLSIEEHERYLDVTRLTDRIRAALETGSGFSMIRLGDGEGAFCRISDEDEARFPNLYRRNREDRARVWFDGQIDLETSGFNNVAFGLGDVIRNADVVGLPYTSWIQHEFKIQSPTGISSLVNALRLTTMPGIDVGQSFCRQSVHIELHQREALAEFIRSQRRIGLISCHSALPDRIKAHFGLDEVVFFKIPGEKLFEAKIGKDSSAGVHFPDRFEQVMADLSRPLDGMLFLVAGGILGKFYCERIKQWGGVALDIGSLADAWLGVDTRPGYKALDAELDASTGPAPTVDRAQTITPEANAAASGDSIRMTDVWHDINREVFRGEDPYLGFVPDLDQVDVQGWNSHHTFLADTVVSSRPRIVVEVGVWKGGSSIHMAQAMRGAGIEGVIISVDTFLGSWEHYEQAEWFPSLKLKNGYPTLFYTFLTNVVASGVQGYIHPLPLDSANAYFVLNRKGIKADIVHIDAGHDFDAVTNDLKMWWNVLAPGGTMIMDDYDEAGVVWPSVRDAVDAFLSSTRHEQREAIPYKLRFKKPTG